MLLDGTLELRFAAGTNVGQQIGRSFQLFDWTGVIRNGAFTVVSPYAWDLSQLYATGAVTLLTPEPASLCLLTLAIVLGMPRRRTL